MTEIELIKPCDLQEGMEVEIMGIRWRVQENDLPWIYLRPLEGELTQFSSSTLNIHADDSNHKFRVIHDS